MTPADRRWSSPRSLRWWAHHDALLGLDLDDVLEGPHPHPIAEPADRRAQVVPAPPLRRLPRGPGWRWRGSDF